MHIFISVHIKRNNLLKGINPLINLLNGLIYAINLHYAINLLKGIKGNILISEIHIPQYRIPISDIF